MENNVRHGECFHIRGFIPSANYLALINRFEFARSSDATKNHVIGRREYHIALTAENVMRMNRYK